MSANGFKFGGSSLGDVFLIAKGKVRPTQRHEKRFVRHRATLCKGGRNAETILSSSAAAKLGQVGEPRD